MNLILFRLFSLEFSSTPSPKFWLSSAMNSSGTDSERLTVTKALTTDLGILSPREEAMATETHRKSENMTTIPRGGTVTPVRETMSFGKSTVALEDHDPCGPSVCDSWRDNYDSYISLDCEPWRNDFDPCGSSVCDPCKDDYHSYASSN